jgi:hypothetical protein
MIEQRFSISSNPDRSCLEIFVTAIRGSNAQCNIVIENKKATQ